MAGFNSFDGDVNVKGTISCQRINIPAGNVTDAAIPSGANVDPTKLQHIHRQTYSQVGTVSAAADRKVLHVVVGATGTVIGVSAGIITAAVGGATVTVDLKKNGTTMLSGVITIDNSKTAYQKIAGAVPSPAVAAGDVLEIVTTAAAGGGTLPLGLFASLEVYELPV